MRWENETPPHCATDLRSPPWPPPILSETVPILITILHCSHARKNAKKYAKCGDIKPAEEKITNCANGSDDNAKNKATSEAYSFLESVWRIHLLGDA
jgi:hypothetical protein